MEPVKIEVKPVNLVKSDGKPNEPVKSPKLEENPPQPESKPKNEPPMPPKPSDSDISIKKEVKNSTNRFYSYKDTPS